VLECLETRIRFESDDDSIPKGGGIEKWSNAMTSSLELTGYNDIPPKLEGFIRDAGFVDVRVVIKKTPVGLWPKDPKKKVRQILIRKCALWDPADWFILGNRPLESRNHRARDNGIWPQSVYSHPGIVGC
jgi:hypothetical protein